MADRNAARKARHTRHRKDHAKKATSTGYVSNITRQRVRMMEQEPANQRLNRLSALIGLTQ